MEQKLLLAVFVACFRSYLPGVKESGRRAYRSLEINSHDRSFTLENPMNYRVTYRTKAGRLISTCVLAPSVSEVPVETRKMYRDVAEILKVQRIVA